MHGTALFFSVFGVVFMAELPDKTALAALVLATRHKPAPVLIGAVTALTIQSAVAVAAGHLLSLLPPRPVHAGAGALFVVSAIVMWFRKEEEEEDIDDRDPDDGSGAAGTSRTRSAGFWRSLWLVFVVVFIAEWGDLTQLATAALAARYKAPLIVFAGSAVALLCVTLLAVAIGHRAGKLLNPHVTKRIAAVLFALVGAALILGLL